jgi:hypothetical protein
MWTPSPVKKDKIRRLSQRRALEDSGSGSSCHAVVALCDLEGARSRCVPIDDDSRSSSGALFLPASIPANAAPSTPSRCGLYVGTRDCDPSTGTRIGSIEFEKGNGEVRFDLVTSDDPAAVSAVPWSFRKRVGVRVYVGSSSHLPRWREDLASAVVERKIDEGIATAVTSIVIPYDLDAVGARDPPRDFYIVAHGTVCRAPLDSSKAATTTVALAA